MRIRLVIIAFCFYALHVHSVRAESIDTIIYSVKNETSAGITITSQTWRARLVDNIEYAEKRDSIEKNTYIPTVEHRDYWGMKISAPGPTYQKIGYLFFDPYPEEINTGIGYLEVRKKEDDVTLESWPLFFSVKKIQDRSQQAEFRSTFTFYLPDKKIMYIIKEYEVGLYMLPISEQRLIVTPDEEGDALVLSYVVYKRQIPNTK